MDIILYSKSGCPYCTFAKKFLNANELKFTEISLDDESARMDFYNKNNCRTMPQIFIKKKDTGSFERVGGYDDMMKRKTEFLEQKISFDADF